MRRVERLAPDVLHLGALALLVAIFFAPMLLQDQTLHRRDLGEAVIPFLAWMSERLQAGDPIRWLGSNVCGEPVGVLASTPELYPPLRLILMASDGPTAAVLNAALHFILAAWGAFSLCRYAGAARSSAFFAAVAVGFAGANFFGLPWHTVLISACWMPWMLLGAALATDERPGRLPAGAAVLGVSTGLSLNGGYPGMVAYAMLPLALLVLQRLWGAHRGRWAASLAAIVAAAALAMAMSSGVIVGLGQLAAESSRGSSLAMEVAAEGSMSPVAVLQALAPHLLGRVGDDTYMGASWRFGTPDPHGLLLYLGLLPALVLLVAAPQRAQAWAWASALALVVYAMGAFTPLYALLLELPVLSHLRSPVKAAMLVPALLCVPLALGFQRALAAGALTLRRALLWGGLGLLAAAAAAIALEPTLLAAGERHISARMLGSAMHFRSPEQYLAKLARALVAVRSHLAQQGAFALAAAALLYWAARRARGSGWAPYALAALLVVDLAWNGFLGSSRIPADYFRVPPPGLAVLKDARPQGFEGGRLLTWGSYEHQKRCFPDGRRDGDREGERAFQELPPGNLARVFGFELFTGFSGGALHRTMRLSAWPLENQAVDRDRETRELQRRRRLMDLGSVRQLLSSRPLPMPGLRPVPGYPDGLGLFAYENLRALPFAYFARQVEGGHSWRSAFEALEDPEDPRSRWPAPALIEGDGPFAASPGTVRWVERTDRRWAMDLECGGAGGTLVLSRVHFPPMFRAVYNGRSLPMLGCNGAFVAVPIPPGQGRLSIELYEPWLAWAHAAFAFGLLLALSLLAWSWRQGAPPPSKDGHARPQ